MSRRALYVCGSCLFRNTSANMSHHGFVRGLVENGYQVEVVMPHESFGPLDPALPRVAGARYHLHSSSSAGRAFVKKVRGWFDHGATEGRAGPSGDTLPLPPPSRREGRVRGLASDVLSAWRQRDPHWASRPWLRRARHFASEAPYDVVLSNSSPASSHRLAADLLSSGRIRTSRWLQVWEDPWYHDVYRKGPAPGVREEEAALLRLADEVFYVSVLTLKYQKMHFPEAASKMRLVPLPAFPPSTDRGDGRERTAFGYFGDFYSHTRDLGPLLSALRVIGATAVICGDTDLDVRDAGNVRVRRRVTLHALREIEADVDVLVAVCNLRGGQLPGKIYHYAATEKPVILVLDGSAEERRAIREHFEPLNRFEFCENDQRSIETVLRGFLERTSPLVARPEASFEARDVVARLLGAQR